MLTSYELSTMTLQPGAGVLLKKKLPSSFAHLNGRSHPLGVTPSLSSAAVKLYSSWLPMVNIQSLHWLPLRIRITLASCSIPSALGLNSSLAKSNAHW